MSGSRMSNEQEHKSPRESGEDSEDESEILEESPCGRWLKRREEVIFSFNYNMHIFRRIQNCCYIVRKSVFLPNLNYSNCAVSARKADEGQGYPYFAVDNPHAFTTVWP